MPVEKQGFVNVDALMRQVTIEQVASYYGVTLPEISQTANEIRTRCFLHCGRSEETGNRALAIQADHPAKIWRCHQAGCGRGGNLVSLCDLLKPGPHGEGKPRGERFKAIIADLVAMTRGEIGRVDASVNPTAISAAESPRKQRPRVNLPLAQSDNERARGLVDLDAKFIVDPAAMSPKAASFFRHRPFLTEDACQRWRVGYLPRDGGGDHTGGTMRGKIVYPLLSESGEVLTWFGRDPEYEGKQHEWIVGGKQGKEPEKYHFVKGFERGLELFGQHRIHDAAFREKARDTGLIIVSGPNDVIALDALGVPAVGSLAMVMTREQIEKIGRYLQEIGGGIAVVMFDCTEAGSLAARTVVVELAQVCPVRMGWSEAMHGKAFSGREVASLTAEEWSVIRPQGSVVADEPVPQGIRRPLRQAVLSRQLLGRTHQGPAEIFSAAECSRSDDRFGHLCGRLPRTRHRMPFHRPVRRAVSTAPMPAIRPATGTSADSISSGCTRPIGGRRNTATIRGIFRRAPTLADFLARYQLLLENCASVLEPGGRMAILMGDYADWKRDLCRWSITHKESASSWD